MSSMKLTSWMTRAASVAVVAAMVLGTLAVAPGNAAEKRFVGNADPTLGNVLWNATTAWADMDGDTVGDVPAAGDKVVFDDNYCAKRNWAIDMAGAALDLGSGSMGWGYGGRNWSYYDSATLTPNNDPLANPTDFNLGAHATLEEAAAASTLLLKMQTQDWSKTGTPRFFIPVEVTGTFKNPENGTLEFYGPATIGTDDVPRNTGWTAKLYYRGAATIGTKNVAGRADGNDEQTWFFGPTTIGALNQNGGKVYFEPTASGTITNLNLTGGLFSNKSASLTITDTSGWTGGTYDAAADGAAAPLGATINLAAGQVLKLSAVQTTFPTINIGAGAALAGDMTNGVYGTTINFADDAIFAEGTPPAGGPLTKADLAAGVMIWKGVTSKGTGTFEAGDDGTSPYKGLAFAAGVFTPAGEVRGTYKALPGSGNLQAKVSGLLDLEYRGPFWIGDGTSTTADFYLDATGRIDLRRRFNEGSIDPDRILTFNIVRTTTPSALDILTTNQQPGIDADQTINVTGGQVRISNFLKNKGNKGLKGALNLTDCILTDPGTDANPAEDTGSISLAGTTFVEMYNPSEMDRYEGLGSLTYPTVDDPTGRVVVVLGGNKTYNIDYDPAGATPVMAGLMQNADIAREQYKDTTFTSDLRIGHGKYLYNTYNRPNGSAVKANTGAETIRYAGNAPAGTTPEIGIAAFKNNTTVKMNVDVGGGTLNLGTDDPSRLTERIWTNYGGTNTYQHGLAEGNINFVPNLSTTNLTIQADKVVVKSGSVSFNMNGTAGVVLDSPLLEFDSATAGADLQLRSYTLDDAGPLAINVLRADEVKFWNLDGSSVHDLSNTSLYVGPNVTKMNADFGGGGASRILKLKGLNINTEMRIDDGAVVEVTGTLAGTGFWSYRNWVKLDDGGTLAPGDGGVGKLNKRGGTGLKVGDNVTYQWDLADPDGDAGTGWDLVWSSRGLFDFDLNDDDAGNLTLKLADAGIERSIDPGEEFVIAATSNNFDIPANWNVSFDAPLGWDTTGAQLATDNRNIDGDGSSENVLYVTGISATVMRWGVDSDGPWDTAANWTDGLAPPTAQVPPADAKVLINRDVAVTVTGPAAPTPVLGSLTVGGGGGAATLVLQGGGDVNTAGPVTIAAGSVLGGNGRINAGGGVIVQGTVAPGTSLGSIEIGGDLTMQEGSVYEFEVGAAGGDAIDVQGALTVPTAADSWTIKLKDLGGFTGDEVTLMTYGRINLAPPLIGDVNNDASVNDTDLNLLLSNYGQAGVGDISGPGGSPDGVVDTFDLDALLGNFGGTFAALELQSAVIDASEVNWTSTGTLMFDSGRMFLAGVNTAAPLQAVPEPAAVVLMLLGALSAAALLRRRRKA